MTTSGTQHDNYSARMEALEAGRDQQHALDLLRCQSNGKFYLLTVRSAPLRGDFGSPITIPSKSTPAVALQRLTLAAKYRRTYVLDFSVEITKQEYHSYHGLEGKL